MPSTAPQQSTRSFVAPSATPVKKTPDITDIIGEGRSEKGEEEKSRRAEKEEEVPAKEVSVAEEQNSRIAESSEENLRESEASASSACNFNESWCAMLDQVFSAIPIIHKPLKESLPNIENNIIKVTVLNDLQKERFEAKKREVLEFLRTHFNEQIEDIIVETNMKMETKKFIYDAKEKWENLKEQNIEIEEFIQTLDLKMKE